MKKKNLISMIILFCLLGVSSDVYASNFTDVKKEDYFFEAAKELNERNILKEKTPGKFKPYDSFTRLEAILAFNEALDLKIPVNYIEILKGFKDVNVNHPYAKEIAAAIQVGIFKGSNGVLGLSNTLTREQMATILVRSYGLEYHNPSYFEEIKDVNLISDSHLQNVIIFYDLGITTGTEKGLFNPRGKVTRGQFATFLHRIIKYDEQYYVVNPTESFLEGTIEKNGFIFNYDEQHNLTINYNKTLPNKYLTVQIYTANSDSHLDMQNTKDGYSVTIPNMKTGSYYIYIYKTNSDGIGEIIHEESVNLLNKSNPIIGVKNSNLVNGAHIQPINKEFEYNDFILFSPNMEFINLDGTSSMINTPALKLVTKKKYGEINHIQFLNEYRGQANTIQEFSYEIYINNRMFTEYYRIRPKN